MRAAWGFLLLICVHGLATAAAPAAKIDREALVTRHSPSIARIDPSAPFMVGNGQFAFTADITGLQTFQEQYSALVPLMTQAQWAWHRFPNPDGYRYEDSLVPVEVRGKTQYFPWLKDWSEAKQPAIAWLRENPHRFSLGRLSLRLLSTKGAAAQFSDLADTRQTLDLWNGVLNSQFQYDGAPVLVQTRVHPDLDLLIVTLTSPLLAQKRLGFDLKFPGVAAALNPDPANWNHPERHRTQITRQDRRSFAIERKLDDTTYFVTGSADREVTFEPAAPHVFHIMPSGGSDSITLKLLFSDRAYRSQFPRAPADDCTYPTMLPGAPTDSRAHPPKLPGAPRDYCADPIQLPDAPTNGWPRFWQTGGVVDFSGSTDPRAKELERRVVLSQYLMAVNAAGTYPPQEEGLFSNSWNGKFHLEMHLWHAAHFALWNHTERLERSLPWYQGQLTQALLRARAHGVRGAWWPKMVGPEGRESPSTITPFILWQQPHPLYLAELIYRARPTRETLARYQKIVFETAELLASICYFDKARGEYVLGPPVIPAQEVFPPLSTFNPTFELEYFRFGLTIAQAWRERLGLPRKAEWDAVLAKLSPLPKKAGLYLATESTPELWDAAGAKLRRDHPSFVGALGLLPGASVDTETMRRTLRAVESQWDLRETWGWDYPLLAMTATRLHEPDKAIDLLLYGAKNNQFGLSGMTPRVHLDEHAANLVPGQKAGVGPDGPGYRRAAETYFPSNGGLLLAIALMTAGWDGNTTPLPGFPKNSAWQVRFEDIRPLP